MPRGNDSRELGKRVGKAVAAKKVDPLSAMIGRYATSKRMTKQAQTMAMDKTKKKRAVSADSKSKTGQAIDMLGKKKAASNKTKKGFKNMGPAKKPKGR